MSRNTMHATPGERVGLGAATSAVIATTAAVVVLLVGWPADDVLAMTFVAAWMGGAWAALSASATRIQEWSAAGLVVALAAVALGAGVAWSGRALWLTLLVMVALGAKALVRP